jgi:hypothetical protein
VEALTSRSKIKTAFADWLKPWASFEVARPKHRMMFTELQPEAAIAYPEKRRGPRYSFIASAELIEVKADVRIASRVSELSMHGCYLDMMNPFPTGTLVLVKIAAGDAFFEARAKIIYEQPNMGAGVAFLEIRPESQTVLERWLDEAEKEKEKLST